MADPHPADGAPPSGDPPADGPRPRAGPSDELAEVARLQAMSLALQAGEVMLTNGVSVADCERLLRRILDAAGLATCDVVVELHRVTLSDLSLDPPRATTVVRKVRASSLHLHRLDSVEVLVRSLEDGDVALVDAVADLDRIAAEPGPWPRGSRFAAMAVAVAAWAVFLGGDALSAIAAAVAAVVVSPVVTLVRRTPVPEVFAIVAAAFVGVMVPYLAAWSGIELRVPPAALGAIYPFLPGAAFVASVTDGLSGSPLSSLARGLEALLVGLGVALGVLIGLRVVEALEIVPADTVGGPLPAVGVGAAAFLALAAQSVARDVPVRAVLPTALLGTMAYGVADLLPSGTIGEDLVVALAALLIGLVGGVLARVQASMPMVYMSVAIIVLVPGTTLYLAMVGFVRGDSSVGLELTEQALATSLAIAAGTALGLAIGQARAPDPARLPNLRLPTAAAPGAWLPWRRRTAVPSAGDEGATGDGPTDGPPSAGAQSPP